MCIDEYGRCRCSNCCLKIVMGVENKCARCDRRQTPDSSLIINHRRLCNVCLNVKACKMTEHCGITKLLLEVSKLREMMQGKLKTGERVTVRYLTAEALNLEMNSFWRDGNDFNCPFGPAGVIVSFTPCSSAKSRLSKGTYTIKLETGELVDVPSADGLRYEGQKFEIRYWSFDRSSLL